MMFGKEKINQVDNLSYIGNIICKDGGYSEDIKNRSQCSGFSNNKLYPGPFGGGDTGVSCTVARRYRFWFFVCV